MESEPCVTVPVSHVESPLCAGWRTVRVKFIDIAPLQHVFTSIMGSGRTGRRTDYSAFAARLLDLSDEKPHPVNGIRGSGRNIEVERKSKSEQRQVEADQWRKTLASFRCEILSQLRSMEAA